MGKQKSAFEKWMEELRAHAAKSQSLGDGIITPERQQEIEKQIGRKLTREEIIRGEIDRQETRTFAEALEHSNWRPVMQQTGDDGLDAMIREAEQKVKEKHLMSLNPEERELAMLKDMKLQRQREEATKAEYEARMNDPKVREAVAKLELLKAKVAFDPTWTVGDMQSIEKAILQLTTPGADVSEGIKLTKEALGVAAAKREAIVQQLREQQHDLAAQVAALDEEMSLEFDADPIESVDEIKSSKPSPRPEWLAEESELKGRLDSANEVMSQFESDSDSDEYTNALLAAADARLAYDSHVATRSDSSNSE